MGNKGTKSLSWSLIKSGTVAFKAKIAFEEVVFDMSNAVCRRLINNGRSSNRMPCTSEPTLRRDRNAIRIRESRTKFLDKPSALVWCRIHKADFRTRPVVDFLEHGEPKVGRSPQGKFVKQVI
jgi:hypothetical protein